MLPNFWTVKKELILIQGDNKRISDCFISQKVAINVAKCQLFSFGNDNPQVIHLSGKKLADRKSHIYWDSAKTLKRLFKNSADSVVWYIDTWRAWSLHEDTWSLIHEEHVGHGLSLFHISSAQCNEKMIFYSFEIQLKLLNKIGNA